MTILQLYTSTKGRISRQAWWYGAAALAVLYFLAAKLIGLTLHYERVPYSTSASPSEGATFRLEVVRSVATEGSLWWHSVASLAWSVAFSALAWGLCVKRRHDCGANGWEVASLLALSVLKAMMDLIYSVLPAAPVSGPISVLDIAVFMAAPFVACLYLLFALYVLVTLGLLKGNAGTNLYGRDPLAPSASPHDSP